LLRVVSSSGAIADIVCNPSPVAVSRARWRQAI
jgi:hypothetical protein